MSDTPNKTAVSRAQRDGGVCVKSQRSLHKQGRALSSASQSETDDDHLKTLPPTDENRARGFMTLAELSRLASLRIERRQIVDWVRWGYCMAATLMAVERGYRRLDQNHAGKTLQGVVEWAPWPECTPTRILAGGKRRVFESLADAPPEVRADIERAIAKAAARKRRGFLSGNQIADILKVTKEEVLTLDLKFINGVDWRKDDRAAARAEKKKKAKQARRRQNGIRPREESLSRTQPWNDAGMSRAKFYRLPAEERRAILESLARTQERAETVMGSEPETGMTPSRETTLTPNISTLVDKNVIGDQTCLTEAPPSAAPLGARLADDFLAAKTDALRGAQPAGVAHMAGVPDTLRADFPASAASVVETVETRGVVVNIVPAFPQSHPAATAARRDRRNPTAGIIPPVREICCDDFPAQVRHWIKCGAYEAAGDLKKLALSGARGARAEDGIAVAMNTQHRVLIRRMKSHGCDDDMVDDALIALDTRVSDLSTEARAEGVPLADMLLPDETTPPPPNDQNPDGRAWRAAA